MKKCYLFPVLMICLSLFSCKKESEETVSTLAETSIIKDQYGRQLILHGLNTSSSAKSEPLRNPWIIESDVEREAKEFGFNFVRYLIFWDAIEPQKDVFDQAYLDRVEERVNWYTSRGMYVMLDMHQDLYSAKFGGDGAPEWAIRTDGAEPLDFGPDTPWWLKNIDPQVMKSWTNFWEYTRHKDLQDHYILAWQKVLERFKSNPYVIGYDLMNEPWGGDIVKVYLTGDFERVQLAAFYERVIPALRTVEPNKYLFFEPTPSPVTSGSPSNLGKVNGTNLVYAPHCYPYDTHEGAGYTAKARKQFKDWERERIKEAKMHGNIPIMCGEFGLSPNQEGFADHLNDFNTAFDRNQWHWTYWSNDKGGWSPLNEDRTETAILPFLIRTYPKATAGRINNFSFDPDSKIFKMTFKSMSSIGKPSEIFVPRRYYPSGYNLVVSGTTNYTQEYDETFQVLKFSTPENTEISIEISPK